MSAEEHDDTQLSQGLAETRRAERAPTPAGEQPQRGASIGRYLVLDPLGRGGMSVVYAGYDPELDRRVAIKLVRPELEGGAEATARLLREAQAMARVRHPHVVTVYDAGTFEGRVFLAMELVEGGTLRTWLAEKPRTRREVLAMFAAAGQGLAAAHAAGLVHRDFKPDNVLVGREGRPRVTDFGLVKPLEGAAETITRSAISWKSEGRIDSDGVLTEAGAVLGTPAYMAPEQLLGRVADAQADQFSFAVALYEALYGQRPFEAPDFQTTFKAVTTGRVNAPPAGADVPGWLRRVLVRALAVEPGQRFPSMQALLEALRKDPVARARRVALGASVVLLAASGPGFIAWRAGAETRRCEAAKAELDAVWNPARAAALAATLSAPGLSPQARPRVDEWATRFAHDWRQARALTCRGDLEANEGDARLATSRRCLEARRLEFQAVLDLLGGADPAALALAERAFGGVGDPRSCVAPSAQAGARLTDEDTALVEQLARARAHLLLGHFSDGSKAARGALDVALARQRPALAAAAQFELGRAAHLQGSNHEAEAHYREALLGAEATGEGELALDVRLSLGRLLADELERYDDALWMLEEAKALARRLTLSPERRVQLMLSEVFALEQADRAAQALPLAEQALALARAQGRTSAELAAALSALGNLHSDLGHLRQSSDFYEQYLAVQRATSLLPAEYAFPLSYSGELLVLLGDFERGLERLQQARVALRPVGAHAQHAVIVDAWIAFTAASVARPELTREAGARAVARADELTLPHDVAELRQMLGWAAVYEGRLADAARELAASGRALAPVADVNRRSVLDAVCGEAEVLRRQGRFAEARARLAPAVQAAEVTASHFEQSLGLARTLLTALDLALGRPAADARTAVAEDLAALERELGEDNADLALPLLTLARLDDAAGDSAAATARAERALRLALRRPGDRFTIAEARLALARTAPTERAAELLAAAREDVRALPERTQLHLELERLPAR